MADTYLADRRFILGDDGPLSFTVTDDDGADMSTATATARVTDSAGVELIPTLAMTGTGTTSRKFSTPLTTGTGDDIEVIGNYTGVYIVTFGTQVKTFIQTIRVLPVPPLYPDIRSWVTFLLPSVDDTRIDFVITGVVGELLALGGCFTTYDALSATQKVFFDKAAGMKAAYLLYNLPTTSSVAGSGEVKAITQGPVKWEYDVGTTIRTQGNTAYWLSEYEAALREICPEALNANRRAKSSSPVSTLPNSVDPRDSLYASDVERVADL